MAVRVTIALPSRRYKSTIAVKIIVCRPRRLNAIKAEFADLQAVRGRVHSTWLKTG